MASTGAFVWCVLAGSAAALAATCGKLGGGAVPVFARGWELPFRGLCYGGLVACNVVMWSMVC